jgi:branched-chain amino acid transport system ATP-binding protein
MDEGERLTGAGSRALPAEGGTGGPAVGGTGSPGQAPILELDRVSLSFGGLRALSDLELNVRDAEVVSVIGPNGAGKTTVFNVITGIYEPSSGDVRFAGRSIAGHSPHGIARLGIARTFQSLRLFLNMSVIENVMTATYGGTRATPGESILRLPRARREEREVRALAEDILSFFGQRLAGYRWDQPAYSLSYANRRRLEIARALATRPRLLLLDEPAAGMNPVETHEVTELIGRLCAERDVAILVIEHDMHVVAGCSDRVIALDHGVKIAEGGFDEVAGHPAVVEAYMGRDPEALAEPE